uniref:Band 7 domain-containing protein n=1 Tax=Paramoeba aestuarina TaxID=180227 RepID=A0A7S4NQ67_9EUKA|mmetsp:Transcript_23618/g.36845  ORF Transcript_23618/g.36845 Transcript_23618/m.36845 type:complete len:298 (+) Transcript_23618:61-954(+)|eukprot:CAMPEP_0201534750 /NCGR_PEP_ID=MMETSP0161_2-20130828/57091_1 /ASSEMBLY_ACC=CAM_ASM_000251 /TAXON_ID=180227 /ORGANISM="Neoparamoeba aestuarina, Strain SoJaBio B1-5/56/2" /LENGTH=297 /DNA_ID=CAMNT_0047939549 /DNA_START=34 /DNA_END=927 /DNA_ORIENTATION=+
MGCCQAVPENSLAIVEQFGAFKEVSTPGCLCLNPCCGENMVGTVSLRVRQLVVVCETKTSDNVFVEIEVSVQFKALKESAYDAFYKLSNIREQIRSYVYDVIRSGVPKITLDILFEQKDELAHSVRDNLDKTMSAYGYEIIQSLIIDIRPAKNVVDAMNEINANLRLRVAALDRSEAEKIEVVKAAEADAEAKYLAGVGVARQRKAIVDGMKESVSNFSDSVQGTTPKDVMDLVLVTQYFDTVKDLGKESKRATVFIPHSPGSVSQISNEISKVGLMTHTPRGGGGQPPHLVPQLLE